MKTLKMLPIVFFTFLILHPSFIKGVDENGASIGAENQEARKLVEAELQKYFIKCEGHGYILSIRPKDSRLVISELGDPDKGKLTFTEYPISEADRLKGSEYLGALKYEHPGPCRYPNNDQSSWGNWLQVSTVMYMDIRKENGKWNISKAWIKDFPNYPRVYYAQGTCSDIPNNLKK